MATIYDIAQAAGVAKSTVANALSGKGSVSEATRQRILQVAQEMGYRPNTVARSLFLRKTFTIGLVLPAISNPFYPEVAEAVENIASEYEYQTLLCNTHENHVLGRQHMERLISRWVDGYIILDRSLSIADIEQYFQQGHPIVLFDWQEQQAPQEIPRVCGDYFRAGELAAQHLLEAGHRRVAVIVEEPGQALRLQGFCSCLQTSGVEVFRGMIQQGHSTLESGYEAAKKLLAHPIRPTAIFATTDLMAIGAMDAILDEGLRVPHDISIIGLDNIAPSSYVRPALTTITIPKPQLARDAMELLLAQINENKDESISRLVEPYIVLRQSTASLKL